MTYDYDGAFACGSDDDLVTADVVFTGLINPRTAMVGVGGGRRLTEDRPIGSPGRVHLGVDASLHLVRREGRVGT